MKDLIGLHITKVKKSNSGGSVQSKEVLWK